MVKGVMVIPEGFRRNSCKDIGKAYEVTNIVNLDAMLSYASKKSLGVIYLSNRHGIKYADEDYEYEHTKVSRYDSKDYTLWYCVIADEIERVCLKYDVTDVYFMARTYNKYKDIVKCLKSDGYNVELPIAGMSSERALDVVFKDYI